MQTSSHEPVLISRSALPALLASAATSHSLIFSSIARRLRACPQMV